MPHRSVRQQRADIKTDDQRKSFPAVHNRGRLGATFAEYSTLHGINDAYRAQSCPLRLMWIVAITAALGAAIYECYAIIGGYLHSPVVVSYFVRGNESLRLPDIVMCPLNRFNKTYLDQYNMSEGLIQYLELSFPSVMISPLQWKRFMEIYGNLEQHDRQLSALLDGLGKTFSQFLDEATDFDCEELITDHTVDKVVNGKWVGKISCREWPSFRISSGRCFRLPGQLQEAAGFGYGSRVTVSLPRHLYSPGINQLPINGIVLKLAHSETHLGKSNLDSGGGGLDTDLAFIPAGVYALVSLKATRYEFINDPPRYECLQDTNDTYSRVFCFDKCITEEAEVFCNCSPAASPSPTRQICTAQMYWSCFFYQLVPVLKKKNSRLNYCREKCKPLCKYWEHTSTISFATFPSPEFRHFVPDNATWNKLLDTIILEIYYEHLEYTTIKHFPSMGPDSFLAQLGGQLSLWVGGSILTVIQLLVFFFHWLWAQLPDVRASQSASPSEPAETLTMLPPLTQSHMTMNGYGCNRGSASTFGENNQDEALL